MADTLPDPMKPELVRLALGCGFKPEAVKKWRQRGRVPPKHRPWLLRGARRRLLSISEADFVFKPTGGTGTPRKQNNMVHVGTLAKNIVRRLVYAR